MTRQQQISEYVAINRKFEAYWFPKVKGAIKSKVSIVAEIVRTDGVQAAIRYTSMDLGNFKMRNVIEDLYLTVGLRFARRTERMLRTEKSLELKRFGKNQEWIDFIKRYLLLFLADKITFSVNTTTRDAMLAVLNQSLENGWSQYETLKHLEDMPFTGMQAARIVRTEINRAANVGIRASGETFEYELNKVWISVKDNRTRGVSPKDHADHIHMNGQTVDFNAVFTDPRSGATLQQPGDPKAPAGDTIQCRCSHTYEAKRDEQGKMIPKGGIKKEEVAVIEYKEPDLTGILNEIYDLKMELSGVKQMIPAYTKNQFVREQLQSVVDYVKEIKMPEVDFSEIEKAIKGISFDNGVEEMKEFVSAIKLPESKDVDLSPVLSAINNKEYSPVFNPIVNVKTDSEDVINTVSQMRSALIAVLTELKMEIMKKRKWNFTILESGNKITGAVAQQI